MRLAETITIRLGDRTLELRPTLRAAMTLDRTHGLEHLGGKLVDNNLTAVADTIAETAFGPYDAEEVATFIISGGMAETLTRLGDPLFRLYQGLVGLDLDAAVSAKAEEERSATIGEAHRTLFRIGAGKIGWTPNETLNATPLEIIEAWKGRLELLKDIFGGADDKPAEASLDDKFAALIQRNQARAATWDAA